MTGRQGWAACVPELAIGAVAVVVTCVAAYGVAGQWAVALAASGWAVACIVVLRFSLPATARPLIESSPWRGQGQGSFTGFWRKRGMLADSTASMSSFDAELRPTLQHLLAARLAERHDVSLYQEPERARQVFCRSARQDALWYWLDPARPAETSLGSRGIPPRTLSAIIDRLEQL